MAKKNNLFVAVRTTGGSYPPEGEDIILALDAINVATTKKGITRSTFSVTISPKYFNEYQLQAANIQPGVDYGGVTFIDAAAQFAGWLKANKIANTTTRLIAFGAVDAVKAIYTYMGQALDAVKFYPLQVTQLDLFDIYNVLANREQVPYIPERKVEYLFPVWGIEIDDEMTPAGYVELLYTYLMALFNPIPEEEPVEEQEKEVQLEMVFAP